MPRRVFAVVLAVGLLAVAASALDRSSLIYVAGATANGPVVTLQAAQELCQGPISPPDGARFERVELSAGPRSGSLVVTVEDQAGRTLAHGRTPPVPQGDGRHGTPVTAAVGEVRSSQPLKVCVRGAATLYGAPAIGSPQSATLAGAEAGFDVAMRLERAQGVSLLGALPAVAERASLFKPSWVSPLTLAILAVVLLVAVPALLLVVLRPDQGATRSTQSHSPEHSE